MKIDYVNLDNKKIRGFYSVELNTYFVNIDFINTANLIFLADIGKQSLNKR